MRRHQAHGPAGFSWQAPRVRPTTCCISPVASRWRSATSAVQVGSVRLVPNVAHRALGSGLGNDGLAPPSAWSRRRLKTEARRRKPVPVMPSDPTPRTTSAAPTTPAARRRASARARCFARRPPRASGSRTPSDRSRSDPQNERFSHTPTLISARSCVVTEPIAPASASAATIASAPICRSCELVP